ncbi:MAG TPA: PilN domain-containing protein [Vicinamibacterales bacterium]|jgi:type IV pilus assembly protein PilN
MIRINLLASERTQAKKKLTFQSGQKLTVGCTLILVGAAVLIGWRYWSLARQSKQLDADLASAQQEAARLHSVIVKVQDFEQRKAQLSQRVVLIEDLRKEQKGPVHMLDEISKALPPMLWLTEVKQVGADVVIDGTSTTQTGVSDFVNNLEASGYFKKSIDIIGTRTVPLAKPPGELVSFTLRAQFLTPGEAKPAAEPAVKPKK